MRTTANCSLSFQQAISCAESNDKGNGYAVLAVVTSSGWHREILDGMAMSSPSMPRLIIAYRSAVVQAHPGTSNVGPCTKFPHEGFETIAESHCFMYVLGLLIYGLCTNTYPPLLYHYHAG